MLRFVGWEQVERRIATQTTFTVIGLIQTVWMTNRCWSPFWLNNFECFCGEPNVLLIKREKFEKANTNSLEKNGLHELLKKTADCRIHRLN